jgi:branched-chain amino acid aminotransferase
MYAFVENQFVPIEKATLHVSDLSIHRGYGVFDFLKIGDGHPFFLNDYLDRFFRSASVMKLHVPVSREQLAAVIYEFIIRNSIVDNGIKLILTGGYSQDGYQPVQPNLILLPQAIVLPPPIVMNAGVSIITHEYVREFPQVKTINYAMGIWLIDKIKAANAYDVLYQKDNIVSEFPRSNFFIVNENNTLVTPRNNVLFGVTRKNVIALARENYDVAEADITLDEVFRAKEAFISSTTKRVLPVVRIDGKIIGDGKPGAATLDLYQGLVKLEEADRASTKALSK